MSEPNPTEPTLVAPTHAPVVVETAPPAPAATPQLPTVAPRRRYELAQARLREAEQRMWRSVEQLRTAAQRLEPVRKIRANPMQWVAGGVAVGLFLGWVTAPRRS